MYSQTFYLTLRYIILLCKTEVPEWWIATQKWVAGPDFLTLDSMRAPKFRVGSRPD